MKTKLHSDSTVGQRRGLRVVVGVRRVAQLLDLRQVLPVAAVRTDSVVVCGVKDFSVYGPVPTGFLLVSVVGSLDVLPDVLGHDRDLAQDLRLVDELRAGERHRDDVAAHGDVAVRRAWSFSASLSLIRLNVKATSSAVSGLPSDHLTPSRTVTLTVL